MTLNLRSWSALAICAMATGCVGSPAPAAAAIHTVAADGNLQAILDAAQPGDEIVLTPGATYTGNFTLPAKSGDQVIVIRTGAAADALPGVGTRTSPAYAPVLAKLKAGIGGGGALTAAPGAHHWRIENVEFGANPGGFNDIIVLGGSQSQTLASQMPHHIVLDRVYIHGDAVLGQKRGIALNSGNTEIINSYISDIKSREQDSQAICGWNGAGPYLIENNYLEASGENVLFGGADPSIRDLVPSDIVVRRNTLSKPLSWRAERWAVKNALELKNARRVVIEGNLFENVWLSGQVGFAILFTPANQDRRAPWSVVEDVTFRDNIVRHAGGGVNITGIDHVSGSGRTQRIQITNNVFYDIDSRWGGAGTGIFLQMGLAPRDVVVERNTVVHSGNVITVYGTENGKPSPVEGFVFRENVVRHNDYGVIGDGLAPGVGTLSAYFQRLVFDRNVLAGANPALYPSGNYFPAAAEFDALFANASAGDFSIVPASPFARAAADGGALGADVVRLNAKMSGSTTPSPPSGGQDNDDPQCRRGAKCDGIRQPSKLPRSLEQQH